MKFECRVNGEARIIDVDPLRRLLDVVREDLGLTGTKEGCGEGECGSCTVLVDGAAVCSCLTPVAQVDGHEVTTVEGIARDRAPHHLIAAGGVRCGACTPGLVVTIESLRPVESQADGHRWRELLAGNLCRCTGWNKVIDGAREAAR